jgi:hypothetical protein
MPSQQTCEMSIAVLRKGTLMISINYGNLLAYVLSAEQIVIALFYLSQGQGWKAANFALGAGIVFTITRM